MRTASATSDNRANFVAADTCGNRRRALRLTVDIMQKSRAVFPVKTALHLADITGYSLRNCEYWLSGKATIPGDALAALLQSEWGREFLAAVMSEQTPRWWVKLKAWMASVDLATAERKQRRKLRELLDDANQSPTAAALLLQDEDFYAGQPYPARPVAARRR